MILVASGYTYYAKDMKIWSQTVLPKSLAKSISDDSMQIVVSFMLFAWSLQDRGPGRYREVREAYRIHFHIISPRLDLMARSYDPKTKKKKTNAK